MEQTKYLTASQVCDNFGGVSDMTLWRWLNDPEMNFPRPIYINRRRYFSVDEIETFVQRRAA